MSWQSPTHNISGEVDVAYKENPIQDALKRVNKTRPASRITNTTVGEGEDTNSQIIYLYLAFQTYMQ